MRFSVSSELTAVLLTASKKKKKKKKRRRRKKDVGMLLDVYELIWFKLGLTIDTIERYFLVQVQLNLTLIKSNRSARKRKLLCKLSHEVFDRFGWNLAHC